MRIAVNGWFHDRLATGSGQYLDALAECLPRIASGHEFIVIKRRDEEEQGGRGAGEQGSGGAEGQGRKGAGSGGAEGQEEKGRKGERERRGRAIRNTQYAIRNTHHPSLHPLRPHQHQPGQALVRAGHLPAGLPTVAGRCGVRAVLGLAVVAAVSGGRHRARSDSTARCRCIAAGCSSARTPPW